MGSGARKGGCSRERNAATRQGVADNNIADFGFNVQLVAAWAAISRAVAPMPVDIGLDRVLIIRRLIKHDAVAVAAGDFDFHLATLVPIPTLPPLVTIRRLVQVIGFVPPLTVSMPTHPLD